MWLHSEGPEVSVSTGEFWEDTTSGGGDESLVDSAWQQIEACCSFFQLSLLLLFSR